MNHGDSYNAVAMLISSLRLRGGVNFYSISNSVVPSLYIKEIEEPIAYKSLGQFVQNPA